MKQPLFILGKHRSGTTWLANQLCEHPKIVGIQHEKHQGVHESAYFSHVMSRYGDINQKQNFIEFVEVVSKSDYFKLAMASDKRCLYSFYLKSYEDIFRAIMDNYAENAGADIWLEKTPNHTLYAQQIAKMYKDAKFISIIRPYKEYLQSSVGHITSIKEVNTKNKLIFYIVKFSIERIHYNKIIKKLYKKHPNRSIIVNYMDLKNNKAELMKKICDFIGIPFNRQILNQKYKPNTSFQEGINRKEALKKFHLAIGRITSLFAVCTPLPMLNLISKVNTRIYKKTLPDWFFKMSEQEVFK